MKQNPQSLYQTNKSPIANRPDLGIKHFCTIALLGKWMQGATGQTKFSIVYPLAYVCVKFENPLVPLG